MVAIHIETFQGISHAMVHMDYEFSFFYLLSRVIADSFRAFPFGFALSG